MEISFVAFYPNMSFVPGLLQNLVTGMVVRARRVPETVLGDDWKSYQRAVDVIPIDGKLRP